MKGKACMPQIRREDRGQALVEMALVVVLLLLLLLGIVDFGRAMHTYVVITNAAREGARYASHFPHYPDGIFSVVADYGAENGITLTEGTNITIIPDRPDLATSGEPVVVRVEYPFPTIMGGLIGIDVITLRTGTEMRLFGPDVTPIPTP